MVKARAPESLHEQTDPLSDMLIAETLVSSDPLAFPYTGYRPEVYKS